MTTRPVSETERIQEGPLAGEPAPAPRARLQVVREGGGELPHVARRRAEIMGGAGRGTARKFFAGGGLRTGPGEVPSEGTPVGPEHLPDGSVLPVIAASRQVPQADGWGTLEKLGAVLPPPYNPWTLVCAVEESDALPIGISAMAVNIGGFGYELEPLFPTEDPETGEPLKPPPEAIEERKRLALFLASANIELGFTGLLELVDRDVETIGWGTIEVLRNADGQLAALEHLPAYSVRLGRLSAPVLCDMPFRHPETGEVVVLRRWRRFRTYVQIRDGVPVYFKQYGDPRRLNWKTGEYKDASSPPFQAEGGNDMNATEVIFRRIYSPHTPYGVPRWIGAMTWVRSGRSAGELICDWFLNAPIGAKLAMVAGGSWKQASLAAAVDKIDHASRGKDAAWSLITLEAETDQGSDPLEDTRDAPPRIALEDLTYALPADLYKGPDSLAAVAHQRVRRMFALGAIYFGDSEAESNQAAADTARSLGEEQVFRPIRSLRWEVLFNHEILPSMGVNWWRMRLRGSMTGDNEATFRGLGPFNEGGGTTPNTLIKLFAETTGTKGQKIGEVWGDRPLVLTMKLIEKGINPNLPLEEAMSELQKREEAAAQRLADQRQASLGAGGKPPGAPGAPGGKGKGPPPKSPDLAAKGLELDDATLRALAQVRELAALREALIAAERDREGSG